MDESINIFDKFDGNKRKMLEALESNLNNVTLASKSVNMSRAIHYHWLKTDDEYLEAVNDLDNLVLDFAENKLHSLIKQENPTSIIFFLKTKGKKRGYIERQEIEEVNKNHFDFSDYTEEQLLEMLNNPEK